jgi:hypothetical protein
MVKNAPDRGSRGQRVNAILAAYLDAAAAGHAPGRAELPARHPVANQKNIGARARVGEHSL